MILLVRTNQLVSVGFNLKEFNGIENAKRAQNELRIQDQPSLAYHQPRHFSQQPRNQTIRRQSLDFHLIGKLLIGIDVLYIVMVFERFN